MAGSRSISPLVGADKEELVLQSAKGGLKLARVDGTCCFVPCFSPSSVCPWLRPMFRLHFTLPFASSYFCFVLVFVEGGDEEGGGIFRSLRHPVVLTIIPPHSYRSQLSLWLREAFSLSLFLPLFHLFTLS